MSKKSFEKMFRPTLVLFALLGVGLIVGQSGCSHKKTNRGHLFRCDWALEYNRTPWIGCPPDTGCDDERSCSCGTGDCSGKNCSNKGFRRHCGTNPECTAKKPCCRTLGCGMWIEPSNPNSFGGMGTGAKACGMTPFCSPMKPCCLTPLCGRNSMSSQPMMFGSQGMMMDGNSALPDASPGLPGVSPTPVQPNGVPNQKQETPGQKPPTMAGPTGLLISQGIVPGVSTITTGGLVAAAGVTTPAGTMTPVGVRLANGAINNQVVLRACGLHPGCNAGRPCCMTPNCGNLVPIAMVSNNAVHLASALSNPGVQGGVMQAGGMPIPVGGRVNGMLVNPISGQPVYGLSMNGMPQVGYPPIGYTPSGYSPKYPRFDGLGMGMGAMQNQPKEEGGEEEEPAAESPITKSQMPVPRFHPVPSKPAFQRSQGMPVAPRSAGNSQKVSSNRRRASAALDWMDEESLAYHDEETGYESRSESRYENKGELFSKASINAAMKKAYLEGMSAAMEEVEAELDAQKQKRHEAEMQAKVLEQAKKLQAKIDVKDSTDQAVGQNESNAQREEELLAEQERLQQLERQERFQARREAEQRRREQQLREEAAMLQAQKNQILQAQMLVSMQQQLGQPTQAVQQAGFDASSEKGFLASTVGFLKGSDQRPGTQSSQQQYQQQQIPKTSDNEITLIQSAKSLGSDLVSPLSSLFGSNGKSSQNQSQYQRNVNMQNGNSAQSSQNINLTAEQQQALHKMQQAQIQQMLQNNGKTMNKRPASYVRCPPETLNHTKTRTSQNTNRTAKRNSVSRNYDNEMLGSFADDKPQRPPTGVRQFSQASKIIEVDDSYEDSMVRQANYIDSH